MAKGIHDERYRTLIAAMRSARLEQGVSQEALAAKVGQRQQFVSKYEAGERRLDVIELIDVAHALGLDLYALLDPVVTASRLN